MSLFTDRLQFTPEELRTSRVCLQILQLSRCQWNAHAAMQLYSIAKRDSQRIIREVQTLSEVIDTCIHNNVFMRQSEFETCVVRHERVVTLALVQDSVAIYALLREYYRATPPPYRNRRTFEQWREAKTGVQRSQPRTVQLPQVSEDAPSHTQPSRSRKPRKARASRRKKLEE